MFTDMEKICSRPKPFEYYTAELLWTDGYTSQKMLEYHLNESVDISSRNIEFIKRSVEWIASFFNVDMNTTIADFGCGPGLYTNRFAGKGSRVTGIDFSQNSIQYAKEAAEQKGLPVDYIHKNYLDYDTEKRFDLITMIMCDFCALSPDQRKRMLKKFRKLLNKGGRVLLDAYTLAAFDRRTETTVYERNMLDGFWAPEDYYAFLNTFKYDMEKVILDKYTVLTQSRTFTVYNWLQYFSPEMLQQEFEDNGFIVRGVFNDVAGTEHTPDSEEIAIVAEKK